MKPQTLALAEYFNKGNSITRESAWQLFKIQNITARLSELSSLGYDILKTPLKVLIEGSSVRISAWKVRDPITPGCTVKVVKDIGTFTPLKGKIGTVEKVTLPTAMATIHITGVGYRSLRFNTLRRQPSYPPGTRVTLTPVPYVVLGYNAGVNSYVLTSPRPEHTIVAHASLVEVYAQA